MLPCTWGAQSKSTLLCTLPEAPKTAGCASLFLQEFVLSCRGCYYMHCVKSSAKLTQINTIFSHENMAKKKAAYENKIKDSLPMWEKWFFIMSERSSVYIRLAGFHLLLHRFLFTIYVLYGTLWYLIVLYGSVWYIQRKFTSLQSLDFIDFFQRCKKLQQKLSVVIFFSCAFFFGFKLNFCIF